MKRKKHVLRMDLQKEIRVDKEFRKVLELGLLLALKEKGIISQYQFDNAEGKIR